MRKLLRSRDLLPVVYHAIFDYPLTEDELVKWEIARKVGEVKKVVKVLKVAKVKRQGKDYYFLDGWEKIVSGRLKKEAFSRPKLEIAKKAAKILSRVQTIRMIGITGSLAMRNSGRESDIDLMIITKEGTLWLTRLLSLIGLIGLIRRAGRLETQNKLCLNIWLDENNLVWPKSGRNLFTAHEIAQIVPLVNKNNTYEKFIWENRWIREYWPNAVRLNHKLRDVNYGKQQRQLFSLLERLAYCVQYQHMKSKITHEIIGPTRAIFHPNDLSKVVLDKLKATLLK